MVKKQEDNYEMESQIELLVENNKKLEKVT